MTLKEAKDFVKALLVESGVEKPIDGFINEYIKNGLYSIASELPTLFVYMVDLVGTSYSNSDDKSPTRDDQVSYPISTEIREFDLSNYINQGTSESTSPAQSITPPTFEKKHHLISISRVFLNNKKLFRRTESQYLDDDTFYIYTIPRFGIIRFDPKVGKGDKVRIVYQYAPTLPSDESSDLGIPDMLRLAISYYATGHYLSALSKGSSKGMFNMYAYEIKKVKDTLSNSSDALHITPYDSPRGF